ncbi:MAG TPA: hypothetical protein PKY64_05785 [Anaerolineaceae bacterium]|nr:hypothetical protein [Anaerolineaceae bacterium]
MKIKTILLTSFLVVSLLLASCGSKEPTETTVNLPVISGEVEMEVENTPVPTVATEAQVPQDTYPVDQPLEPVAQEAAIAYPVDDDSTTYDADMRAYIEQILGGTIAIEELFGKEDDQLREILYNAAQGRFILSETGLDKAIDWLKKQ